MKLVFLRHGQSELNQLNVFTGWLDPKLTKNGELEAQHAGELLRASGLEFDYVHTSVLTRAIQTTHLALEVMDQLYLPVTKHWRLNERHYGALQGLNKAETAVKYGDEQVHIWRRSYDVRPPQAEAVTLDRRYDQLDHSHLLAGESLADTLVRTLPYWQDAIVPQIKEGKNVLVVAHGNSIRSLMKYLENLSEEELLQLELATGEPVVYELDSDLTILKKEILYK